MNVLDVQIRWNLTWANSPVAEILVANVPDKDVLRYEERENIYFAQHEGYVSFFYYKAPGSGFGGRSFPIKMMDGSEKVLKGPWSSGTYAANKYFTPSVEVSYTTDPNVMKKGHTFYGGNVTVGLLAHAIHKYLPGVELKAMWFLGRDLVYVPVWAKNPCNHDGYTKEDVSPNGRCRKCSHKVYGMDRHGILFELNKPPVDDGYTSDSLSGQQALIVGS